MMETIVMHSYSYLMNSNYERINGGKSYDLNFKAYQKDLIDKMIFYFEEREEYEKCKVLLDFSRDRFDHEKNYTMA
jgi:hypothetical protein